MPKAARSCFKGKRKVISYGPCAVIPALIVCELGSGGQHVSVIRLFTRVAFRAFVAVWKIVFVQGLVHRSSIR